MENKLSDKEFEDKFGICREDAKQTILENSDAYKIWRYEHR